MRKITGMIKNIVIVFVFLIFISGTYNIQAQETDYEQIINNAADWRSNAAVCRPVPMCNVKISGFLGTHIDRNLKSILEGIKSPIPRGFEARAENMEPPPNRLAADSDLYKWLEGACYVFARTGDVNIKKEIDRITGLIMKCQHNDGYINTQVPPNKRFDMRIRHDLYIAGHFFEAAAAHYRATGKRDLLHAASRWADYILEQYNNNHQYFKIVGKSEHSEYELGFLRLYRAAGEKKYLDFAITLAKMAPLGPKVGDIKVGGGSLHAVRFGYLLTGLADLYLETGREDLFQYLPDLWNELVSTRMYVTGGLGYQEGIPERPYFLPQILTYHKRRDIAETCASVAMMMFSWRMHSLIGKSCYFDVIERILYNHYLGAISLDHLGNFYYNPLRLVGDVSDVTDHDGPKARRIMLPQIHSTACCLPNCWRFFGALPEYIFSYNNTGLFINLYTSGNIQHTLSDGTEINLQIETNYPHDGKVAIHFKGENSAKFNLHLRIPAWCKNASVRLNGQKPDIINGGKYYNINRSWNQGDFVNISFEMPVRMVSSNPLIAENLGQVVFARGPLVYCLEQKDLAFPVELARVSIKPDEVNKFIEVEWRDDILDGINLINIPGIIANSYNQNIYPYFTLTDVGQHTNLTLIPFYARANRSDDNRWTTFIPLSP